MLTHRRSNEKKKTSIIMLWLKKTLAYCIIICCVCFIAACGQHNVKFLSGSFEQALQQAQKRDKLLIVIAEIEDCDACRVFEEKLSGEDQELKELVSNNFLIFRYKRNQVGNDLLFYISNSVGSPTSYIFNTNGKIVSIISGNKPNEELKDELTACINGNPSLTLYMPRLKADNKALINLYNQYLSAYKDYTEVQGDTAKLQNVLQVFSETTETIPYFFNHYMTAKALLKIGDTIGSREWAERAMTFNGSYDVYLYSTLRKEMKYHLNNDATNNSHPYLAFESLACDFGIVPLKKNAVKEFNFKNTGKEPLVINDVKSSCSCVDVEWSKEGIMPGKEGFVRVTYKADHEGAFSKVVFVNSNATNELMQLSIKGIVD